VTKLAFLIRHEEGGDTPGTLPYRNHNPGDLRHSPHSQHSPGDPNAIGYIDDDADGLADLERQLRIFADRGCTLQQTIYTWAPVGDNNDSARYLADVIAGFGGVVDAETPLASVLEIQA
jgi:hypothetical protein